MNKHAPAPAFRFIDLFAGIGGFHHALSDPVFGGECVMAADIDPDCRRVYGATWPTLEASGGIVGDIRSLTMTPDGKDRTIKELADLIPDHDVLCAGFPMRFKSTAISCSSLNSKSSISHGLTP